MLGNDPLLQSRNYGLTEMDREQDMLKQKLEDLQKRQYPQQHAAAPTWDEIDRITSALSEKEFNFLKSNQEFQDSSVAIQQILQNEYMRIMRPVVESTKEGKDALDKHLTLLKRLVKSAKDEADHRDALMNEYITQYSNLTWQEFIDMQTKKQS